MPDILVQIIISLAVGISISTSVSLSFTTKDNPANIKRVVFFIFLFLTIGTYIFLDFFGFHSVIINFIR